jgi:hypothetical protein
VTSVVPQDRYELLVAFSTQLDDWGMITDPDDFDDRSHDVLVSEYRNKLQMRNLLDRADGLPDNELLIGYVNWLDGVGTLKTWGPGVDGFDDMVKRFLEEPHIARG